jgi:hypothetical protein
MKGPSSRCRRACTHARFDLVQAESTPGTAGVDLHKDKTDRTYPVPAPPHFMPFKPSEFQKALF